MTLPLLPPGQVLLAFGAIDADKYLPATPSWASAEIERRDLPQRLAERGHRAGEQLCTTFGSGRGRVTDDPIGMEGVRQPPEADPSAETDVRVVVQLVGHTSNRRAHVAELGREVQHHRRLVGA